MPPRLIHHARAYPLLQHVLSPLARETSNQTLRSCMLLVILIRFVVIYIY
jgi:hypothetical protein